MSCVRCIFTKLKLRSQQSVVWDGRACLASQIVLSDLSALWQCFPFLGSKVQGLGFRV